MDPTQVILLYTAYPDAALTAAAERLGVRECIAKTEIRYLVRHLRATVG